MTDPRVRAISFTGSTAVGKQIQQQAAANLTRTQLELGGKNALIVMDDADLAQAVDAAITAGFSNAGQWCTSTSRVLLHRPIARPFLQTLVARCEKMTVGDGLSETTDMGPVAGPQQYQDIRAAIREAEAEGARMVAGDERRVRAPTRARLLHPPDGLHGRHADMAIFREEIFGPVLAVCEFESVDEAIALGEPLDVRALFRHLHEQTSARPEAYIDGIEAGLAHVNIHTGYKEPAMPFGGVKQSGAGLPENSETGLEFFVDRKAVYVRG